MRRTIQITNLYILPRHADDSRESSRKGVHMITLFTIDLHMFDGGAAAGGAPAGDGGGEAGQAAGTTATPEIGRRGKKSGDSGPQVVYGKQPGTETATSQVAAETVTPESKPAKSPKELRDEFEALIKGEYKTVFTERSQEVIDRRFKETKTLQEQLDAVMPVLDVLKGKYNLTDTDPAKLREAIERDETMWADKAAEAGMSVDQYKSTQKIMRENETLRKDQERRVGMEQAQKQYAQWVQQEQEAKGLYPQLDLRAELAADPQFAQMLRVGVPVQTAYEALHMNELKVGLAQGAAKVTEKQVVDNLRAKGARPSENGATAKNPGVIIKNDPSQLTKADRQEIARRVARGEHITF